MADGLPHNFETERALLGGLMLSGHQFGDVSRILPAADFSKPAHAKLYAVIADLVEKTGGCDTVSVLDRISADGDYDSYGGAAYVVALPQACTTVDNLPNYAGRIREHAIRRRLVSHCQGIIEVASALPIDDLARAYERGGEELYQRRTGGDNLVQIAGPANEALARAVERAEGKSAGLVTTGMPALDRFLGGGLEIGTFVVIGARPAMGKTALALSVAFKAARAGVGVLNLSLELASSISATRILAQASRIPSSVIRSGKNLDGSPMTPTQYRDAVDAVDGMARLPLWMDDTPSQSVANVRSAIRRCRERCPNLQLVIVDYLQIMAMDRNGKRSTADVIGGVAQDLRDMCKTEGVVIMALSQLNREVDKRTGQRPQLSDLRDSGGIEAAAMQVWFPWRESVTNPGDPSLRDKAELIIAKNTNGDTGTVPFKWHGQYQEFADEEVGRDNGYY